MLALITGASSGIGRDMAREMAKRGYDLVLVARNEEGLEKIKKELQERYEKLNIDTYALDLSVQKNCYQLHEQVKNVDILINNAGFGLFGRFENTDLEKEIDMIDTNVTAYHILMKLYLQDMVKKNSGHILNVASIAGFMPGPLMATYYATKNYIYRLTESIQYELHKQKSKVVLSVLCPGPVATNFNQVAKVKFNLKERSSEEIAKYAIDKLLKNKKVIVPGLDIKLARFFSKIVPDRILMIFSYLAQDKKR